MKKDTKEFRSSKYQWSILEVPFDMGNDSFIANKYDNDTHIFETFQKVEEIEQLDNEVLVLLFTLVTPELTDKQNFVLDLLFKGFTQKEIIGLYNIKYNHNFSNNATISRMITGDISRKTKQRKGGIYNKIKLVCLSSETFRQACLNLHQHIQFINYPNSTKSLHLIRSWFATLEDYLDWLEIKIESAPPTILQKKPKQHYSKMKRSKLKPAQLKEILKKSISTNDKVKKYNVTRTYVNYLMNNYYARHTP